MNTIVKKTIIAIFIVVVFVGLYFGAYLPYKKANAFITTIHLLQSVESVDELKYRFDKVLNINSPVARDEVVGFTLNQLTNLIRNGLSEEVGGLIVGYAEEIARPILADSQSPELTKIILKMGIVYQTTWSIYEDKVYAEAAENLYLRGLEVSPNRPQFLYGLFDLYLSEGRVKEAIEVGEQITAIWPADSLVGQKLQLLKASE